MTQAAVLYFFQSFASPVLDSFVQGITMLGEQYVFMTVLAVFFWGISKKTGLIMSSTLLISLFFNNLLKILFHSPRPFEVLDHLEGKRLETATGYSFPSGHTQGASSFYTTLIYLYKNPLFRIFCALIILLVGISRIYLGVHWPMDVLGGWVLGILIAWVTASAVNRLWETPDRLEKFLIYLVLFSLVLTAVLTLCELLFFHGSVKVDDFFKGAGILTGSFSGFILERRLSDFDSAGGSVLLKVLRIALGLAGTLLIQGGLKILFPETFLFHSLRYFIMGFWITFLFPWLGCRTGLFQSCKS